MNTQEVLSPDAVTAGYRDASEKDSEELLKISSLYKEYEALRQTLVWRRQDLEKRS